MEPQVRVFASSAEAVEHAARTLEETARSRPSGRIAVALSGGSTPALLYDRLARSHRDAVPWERIDFFFGDERAVPPDHPDSNYRLAWTRLLSRVPAPPGNIHRMPAGEADPAEAAACYEEEIRRTVPGGPGGTPRFDLIWLGLGDDGHTASLFPGTAALDEKRRLVVAHQVPAKGARMTFTLPLLNAARRVQFLVLGRAKAPVVRRVLRTAPGEAPGPSLPAARVHPTDGVLEWVLDREAAAEIGGQGRS